MDINIVNVFAIIGAIIVRAVVALNIAAVGAISIIGKAERGFRQWTGSKDKERREQAKRKGRRLRSPREEKETQRKQEE